MALPGDWQLKYVGACIRHRRELVPLWTENAILRRWDLQGRFAESASDGLEERQSAGITEPTSFEIWLDHRLETGDDETEMKSFGLYAALETCRLLGTELLRLTNDVNPPPAIASAERRALQAGFTVVSRGEEAIATALDDLKALVVQGNHKPKRAFGMFWEQLSRDLVDEPDFASFRRVMRESIVATWPVAAGEVLLGEIVPERRLHSIWSASEETGYSPIPLREVLIDVGAISVRDSRTDALVTFDTKAYAEALDGLPKFIGFQALAKHMNATEHHLKALVREGLLAPRIPIPSFRAPWKASDGSDLVDGLLQETVSVSPEEEGWEHIHRAAFRKGSGLRRLFDAIASGAVEVGTLEGVKGYRSVLVKSADVDALRAGGDGEPITKHQTVAEFERAQGMRHGQMFAALVAAGLTPATVNSASGHRRTYVTADDAEEFHARFTTLSNLSLEIGAPILQWRTVCDARGSFPSFMRERRSDIFICEPMSIG